ncbi:hypothetical protein HW555_010361 [Spodoptera exigua]|uniref:Gustatory receptor n=1 Tax=Spodoptera exigua TaxID=7107 RepID=A0A835GB89_SPOEX|nr:hypothetical protein HW555_010361 [Spodoptera exigua]
MIRSLKNKKNKNPCTTIHKYRLDKDIQKILYPFNLMFKLQFSSKYCIKDGYITANGVKSQILAFLNVCFVLVRTINAFGRNLGYLQNSIQIIKIKLNYHHRTIPYPDLMYCALTLIWMVKYISIIILQSVYCEKFYITVEKAEMECIQRMMNINCSNKDVQRIFYPFNCLLLLLCTPKYAIKDSYIVPNGMKQTILSFLIFGFMAFLWVIKDIVLIVIQSLQCEKFYIANERAKISCILPISDMNCSKGQIRLYKQLIQTNRGFSKMSAYGLFYVDARLTISVVGLFTGYHLYTYLIPSVGLAVFLWITKDILLLVAQNIECEKFYIANEQAKLACMQLMKNKNCSNPEKLLHKQVLRTSRAFSKISACGFFYIDAQLPMNVIGLLTGYVCVLIQFAFI